MEVDMTVLKVLEELRDDIHRVREDVEMLKGLFLEDSVLSEDEQVAVETAHKEFREGKTISLEALKKEFGR